MVSSCCYLCLGLLIGASVVYFPMAWIWDANWRFICEKARQGQFAEL